MKKLLIYTFVVLNHIALAHGPHGHNEATHSHDNVNHSLQFYEGDFTDTDNDGMTDVYELKYGYNPYDAYSFPEADFVADAEDEDKGFLIDSHEFMNLRLFIEEGGFSIKWDDDLSANFSKYSLMLVKNEETLFYGGHMWDSAKVVLGSLSELDGSEIIRGRFSEYDSNNGEFVKDHSWFEIDLSQYSFLTDNNLGEDTDKVKFKFTNFSDDQKERYVDFMRRVIPIMYNIVGNPAESFVCEFIMNQSTMDAWMTGDQGRFIELDTNWNPRLFIHELIHMWDGKYAFCWSGDERQYEDDYSGFAEIAEGIAYKILHEFVMAYPNHPDSITTISGGAWNNWSAEASTYDLYKHQRFTGGGTFWPGDVRSYNFRYSNSAMLVQNILVENPNFVKDMRNNLFAMLKSDTSKILNRNEIVNLWASTVKTINGIDTTEYLNAMPVFNGKKLDQGFYPIVRIVSPSEVDVYSSYAVDGLFWWSFITNENYNDFNIPSWVKSNYNSEDGYYYLDMNDMPYTLSVKNIFAETIESHNLRSANTYQDQNNIIPDDFGEIRVTNELAISPMDFEQGLYLYNLTYTDVAKYTDEATEDFYFMGQKNIYQNDGEYVLIVGVDSKFAEKITLSIPSLGINKNLQVINNAGVFKTSEIPLNSEALIEIVVESNNESFKYKRALVHAGNQVGEYRQQFLIIDRDFDGIEDLYDNDVSDSYINEKYKNYNSNDPQKENETLPDSVIDLGDSIDLGNGWRFLDWFGHYFKPNENSDWIFHVQLGWLYVSIKSSNDIWMYSSKFGWFWTAQNCFPFVANSTGNWKYFDLQRKLVYDFDLKKYIRF